MSAGRVGVASRASSARVKRWSVYVRKSVGETTDSSVGETAFLAYVVKYIILCPKGLEVRQTQRQTKAAEKVCDSFAWKPDARIKQ